MAHLDIKMENILFDKDCNLKICDFGFSDTVSTRLYEANGTQAYMSPEMFGSQTSSRGYSAAQADIFALGVSFFIVTFGIPPFLAATQSDNYYKLFHRMEGPNKMQNFIRLHPATQSVKGIFNDKAFPESLTEDDQRNVK